MLSSVFPSYYNMVYLQNIVQTNIKWSKEHCFSYRQQLVLTFCQKPCT